MSNRRRLARLIRTKLQSAGRQYEEAKHAYRDGRATTETDLPRDDDGKARIVCRRYAEQRAVALDADARPDCFDRDSQDCRGCVEDIREGRVETW